MKEQALLVGLKLIAGIFIFEGLLEGVYALLQLNEGNVHIPIGMVSLFIGVGLLRRRPGWRTGARVVLVLSMGAAAWALFNLIDQPAPIRLAFGEFSSGAFTGFISGIFLIKIWEFRFLSRNDIHMLFNPKNEPV